MDKRVGIFVGKVYGPYPCWIEITDDAGNRVRLSHRDIADLKHLVTECEKHAKLKLGDNSNEV